MARGLRQQILQRPGLQIAHGEVGQAADFPERAATLELKFVMLSPFVKLDIGSLVCRYNVSLYFRIIY